MSRRGHRRAASDQLSWIRHWSLLVVRGRGVEAQTKPERDDVPLRQAPPWRAAGHTPEVTRHLSKRHSDEGVRSGRNPVNSPKRHSAEEPILKRASSKVVPLSADIRSDERPLKFSWCPQPDHPSPTDLSLRRHSITSELSRKRLSSGADSSQPMKRHSGTEAVSAGPAAAPTVPATEPAAEHSEQGRLPTAAAATAPSGNQTKVAAQRPTWIDLAPHQLSVVRGLQVSTPSDTGSDDSFHTALCRTPSAATLSRSVADDAAERQESAAGQTGADSRQEAVRGTHSEGKYWDSVPDELPDTGEKIDRERRNEDSVRLKDHGQIPQLDAIEIRLPTESHLPDVKPSSFGSHTSSTGNFTGKNNVPLGERVTSPLSPPPSPLVPNCRAVAPRVEPEWAPRPRSGSDAPVRRSWQSPAGASVRQRIGQIERELAEARGRPGRKQPGEVGLVGLPTVGWYSNQDEDGHVYFFEEGGSSSHWALPPAAENGASQQIKEMETVAARPVLPPIPPGLRAGARHNRVLSMVAPPAPGGGWPRQLRAGDQTQTILYQGILNRTKVATETARRVRKNWAPCLLVLTDRYLLLFKDIKSAASMQPGDTGHRPETKVDLAGAIITWEPGTSSRKNHFEVCTVHGLRLLLQDDSSTTAENWFRNIRDAIQGIPQGLDRLMPPGRQLLRDDNRLIRSRSARLSGAVSGSSEDLSRDAGWIRDRLRRFFGARPPPDQLVRSGILQDEPVFGCRLAALCEKEGVAVPRLVRECISAIEARPDFMRMDGLYRASGNLSQVQRLRCEVDQEHYQVLWEEEDVHVLTGALKLFFRELPEPVVPFAQLPAALQAAGLPGRTEQVAALSQWAVHLPDCHRHTLRTLLDHLSRVTELHEHNRMHAHNLAIVFGPTLMWTEQDSPDLALDLMKQNRVVEALLENRTQVFGPPAEVDALI